jgi:hypothetical protein
MINNLLSVFPNPQQVQIELDGLQWSWSVPIYTADASTPHQRVCSVDPPSICSNDVPIPTDAIPSPDTDRKMVVVDCTVADQPRAWSFWSLKKQDTANGEWTVGTNAFGWVDLSARGDGLNNYDGGRWGGRASSWNYIAGLILPEEIARGRIDHALAIALPGQALSPSAVWPARGSDGYSRDPYAIPMGSHLQLDPNLDIDSLSLSSGAKVIAKALQTYGAWVGDAGSTIGLDVREFVVLNSDGETRIDSGPWQGLLTFDALYSFPVHRLRVLQVDVANYYQEP